MLLTYFLEFDVGAACKTSLDFLDPLTALLTDHNMSAWLKLDTGLLILTNNTFLLRGRNVGDTEIYKAKALLRS